jgi:hypothetical protein
MMKQILRLLYKGEKMIYRSRSVAGIIFLICLLSFLAAFNSGEILAQEPSLELYFYESMTIQEVCPWPDPYHPGPDYPFTIYFVATDLNMWMSGIEFSVSYPSDVTWLGDTYFSTLHIGSSPDGIAMTWSEPQNAYNPLLVMKANIIYHASIYQNNIRIEALPSPASGRLRAVRWPDNAEIDLSGGCVTFCGSIPIGETTWGRVKALYK